MGVSGLLQLLKSIQRPCHIKDFKGMTLGVDVYCWLHPALLPYAVDLATGKETTRFVNYVMHRIRMLQHYGITPYVVFDGNYLPSKSHTEVSRAASRAEAKRRGLELLKLGRKADAQNELQKAIDVTPEMARNIIDELKAHNIEYIVAPYEADAQLAYLEKEGIIQGIVSQDSDLLVFGAKRLITKLDKFGECIEIRRDDFTSCRTVSFVGWTDDMFRTMAILTGCDYLPGLTSMGLKTAHSLVRRHRDFDKALRAIQYAGKIRVPTTYARDFRVAEQTFLHQRVFCPTKQMLVMRSDWPVERRPEDISFIGEDLTKEVATGVANGSLHPMTKKPLKPFGLFSRTPTRSSPRKSFSAQKGILSTPSDLKGHKKPIDSFFKPRRTPLAELDPNVFTPSPSQQDLLRRTSGSVLSTPVDENNAPLQSFAAPATTGHSLGSGRSSRDRIGLPTGPGSAPNPSKRPRLCDDSPPGQKTKKLDNIEVCRSKFFTSKAPEPSPSLKRQARQRVGGETGKFSIHCDVREDISFSLPDPSDQTPVKTPKLRVFQEQKIETKYCDKPQSLDASQQSSVSSLATSTSSLSSASTDATAYSFTAPSMPSSQSQSQNTSQNQSQVVDESVADEEEEPKPAPRPSLQAFRRVAASSGLTRVKSQSFRRESPLSRLGRQAISRSRSLSNIQSLDLEPVAPAVSSKANRDDPEAAGPSTRPQTPEFGAVQAANFLNSGKEVLDSQGSEDMIVPNSEDDVEVEDEAPKLTKINLGRFVFHS